LKTVRQWVAAAAVLVIVSVPLLAQDHASAFQHNPVEQYGARVLAAVLVLGILAVLFSLFYYRGRLSSTGSWGVLALGVAVFPILTSGFGTVLVFERAQTVEFCGSCHRTMGAFVDDMKNPASNSLAAVHYKNRYIPDNQCYVCHTNYGIFGNWQGKIDGLKDVFGYYTHTFSGPPKLRHPYANDDCLKCHAGAAKFAQAHANNQEDLFSGKTSCLDCHGQNKSAHMVQ